MCNFNKILKELYLVHLYIYTYKAGLYYCMCCTVAIKILRVETLQYSFLAYHQKIEMSEILYKFQKYIAMR